MSWKEVVWFCKNGCEHPSSGCEINDNGDLWASGCCGGGCVIVELNYCPVCGEKIEKQSLKSIKRCRGCRKERDPDSIKPCEKCGTRI